ncbi:MAG: heavy metal translocating P-type ATPase metal-binding domain-containing protein [Halomonadaceae bacterium]|uniref:Heavy metal translocating P-type ATPase n=1 Tax=Halomonas colorata TaxID=2742615 RepID=A0ABR9G1A8_9GAMM|nr:heavy metal translocating P-type ATPase metal-binding domain-containing protein [Halomonas colorata]MBE0464688.1 heavy metal translocating P-type ATPase [Halomonas colorata]
MTAPAAPSCYHCGSHVPADAPWQIVLDETVHPLCCPGCEAVAHAIVQGGLESYYRQRTDLPGNPVNEALNSDAWAHFDSPERQATFVTSESDTEQLSATLAVEGITCNACAWLIEHRLNALEGITASAVDLSHHRLRVSWHANQLKLSQLLAVLATIGYSALPFEPDPTQEHLRHKKRVNAWRLRISGTNLIGITLLAFFLNGAALENVNPHAYTLFHWLPLGLATAVMLFATPPFFRRALVDIRRGLLGPAVPISLALSIAYLASIYATLLHTGEHYAGFITLLTTLLLLGGYVKSSLGLGHVQNTLKDALPASATRLYHDGCEKILPIGELAPGNHVVVKPGQRLPVDGTIEQGTSSLDESVLSGEQLPITRQVGDHVLAGCRNLENSLVIKAILVGADTRTAHISAQVKAAWGEQSLAAINAQNMHRWVSRLLIASLSVTTIGGWLGKAEVLDTLLSMLVVSSFCALAMAHPAILVASYQQLRKRGVVIQTPSALMTLSQTAHVCESLASHPDVVIFSPRKACAGETLVIARAMQRCIRHTSGLAVGISLILFTLAALGFLSPLGAVLGVVISVLAVVANTLCFSRSLSLSAAKGML